MTTKTKDRLYHPIPISNLSCEAIRDKINLGEISLDEDQLITILYYTVKQWANEEAVENVGGEENAPNLRWLAEDAEMRFDETISQLSKMIPDLEYSTLDHLPLGEYE
jgi:hypothetical protein